MYLKIKQLTPFKLMGKCAEMTMMKNSTELLWTEFMTYKISNEIKIDGPLYSLQIYSANYFDSFDVNQKFTKWAGFKVDNDSEHYSELKTLDVVGGLYAVFLHKGQASDFPKTFQYIMDDWFPKSIYDIDDRPHFEVLGEKYIHKSTLSEEEIWIPIKSK